MVKENLKELTKDLIHLEYRIDIHKLEDDCFFISDFYTIVNDQNNEIEITVFEKGNKKLLQITAIVETHSEGTLYYTNYYINESFKKGISKFRLQ